MDVVGRLLVRVNRLNIQDGMLPCLELVLAVNWGCGLAYFHVASTWLEISDSTAA